MVDRIENKAIKADVSATLSRLYSKMDQGKKALFYANLIFPCERILHEPIKLFLFWEMLTIGLGYMILQLFI